MPSRDPASQSASIDVNARYPPELTIPNAFAWDARDGYDSRHTASDGTARTSASTAAITPAKSVSSPSNPAVVEREEFQDDEDAIMENASQRQSSHDATARLYPISGPSNMPPAPPDNDKHDKLLQSAADIPQHSPPLSEPVPVRTRQKRPIDIAFERMKNYSEPPFRQSTMTPAYQSASQPYPYQTSHLPMGRQPSRQDLGKTYPPLSSKRAPSPPSPYRPAISQSSLIPSLTKLQSSHGGTLQPNPLSSHPDGPFAGQKQVKRGLHLRNPLSLLARRKSSRALNEAHQQKTSAPAVPIPDDYDPRIRGKVVHDFSAPRPERGQAGGVGALKNASAIEQYLEDPKRNSRLQTISAIGDYTTHTKEQERTPVFKEQFEDEAHTVEGGPVKRKSEAFMNLMTQSGSLPEPNASALPSFARKLPNRVDSLRRTASPPPNVTIPPRLSTPPKGALEVVPESSDFQKSELSSPPKSPPIARSRGSSMNDQSFQGLGSPMRFKSNSSRFSFDLAGVGSAVQEKLLEDKHRQHEQQKKRDSVLSSDNGVDEQDGYQDYAEMDDGGLEEEIPAAYGDEDDMMVPNMSVSQQTLDNNQFVSPDKSSFESATSPTSNDGTGLTSLETPRDSHGRLGDSIADLHPQRGPQLQSKFSLSDAVPTATLGSETRPRSSPDIKSDYSVQTETLQRVVSSESNLTKLPQGRVPLDDDMYFNDGMLDDDLNLESEQAFDESVFDDNSNGLYGLPLRDRTLRPSELTQDTEDDALQKRSVADAGELRDPVPDLSHLNQTSLSQAAGLTHDNLAAYNSNALALAAFKAAENGAFDRASSRASSGDPDEEPRLGDVIEADTQLARPLNEVAAFEDDDGDDADIVAAANAEALENDDDGFYGQEFGFYARASGSDQAEYVNGGYFGDTPDGIHRSHSGRKDFQEPSLTPITERSEWSNRNSFATHSFPVSAYPSEPQLASLMSLPEDDLDFQALLRLRRSAWGGSYASLPSSGDSQNSGSPLTNMPTMSLPSGLQHNISNINTIGAATNNDPTGSISPGSGGAQQDSFHDGDPPPLPANDSLTITVSTPQPPNTVPAPPATTTSHSMGPPPVPIASHPAASSHQYNSKNTSPQPQNAKSVSWTPGHSRHSSGAEVSYVEEGGNWVLEKRRVSDKGEVEILGRGLVKGGRI